MTENPDQTLQPLVAKLLIKMEARWKDQLADDIKQNIKNCLNVLAKNCPDNTIALQKRRVLIKKTYDLLIQRVKCGFTFDEASSSYGKQIHYLSYDSTKSINIPLFNTHRARERERERERAILKTL